MPWRDGGVSHCFFDVNIPPDAVIVPRRCGNSGHFRDRARAGGSGSGSAGTHNRYHRLICLVHLTGSGTTSNPKRPEYAPTVIDPTRAGIIAWSFQITDDGKMAIVHYVAMNRSATIFADTRPEIRVFEIRKVAPAAIEAEMQKYKANFTLSSVQVVAP